MLQIPRWQVVLVFVILVLGVLYAAPNVVSRGALSSLPDWAPNQQINLGLDLEGGSYLLIEVEMAAVIEEQQNNLVDEMRIELNRAEIGYTGLGVEGEAVTFTLRDTSRIGEAEEIVRDISSDLEMEVSEGGTFRLSFSDNALSARHDAVMSQTIEIIRRRIDETGTREPSIQRHGDDRVLVQLPGVDNPDRIKELLGKTAKLTFRFVEEDVAPEPGSIPPGTEILPSEDVDPVTGNVRRYVIRKRVMVSGESLTNATATFQDGQPVVSFKFDTVGAKRFGDATRNNVGRVFAIVLDGNVISAPVIREPILGGSGVISGDFTVQETQDLALLLRAGALPAPLTYLEERTVGPGLGADSVRAGKIASVMGLVFVVVFMALSYGLFGVMADVALVANLILIVAVLSALQATLTLPGIAGIVLTIGMAVDANVLVFERIREETHVNARGPVTAIDAGYRRALSSIVDANLTTLIAAVILFQFGTGPVRGFAVTLSIGLVTSMFTAIWVTRLQLVAWLRRRRPQALAV